MGTRDKRINAYIAKSADFAQPILHELRELVHKACPDVEEAMKWSFPHFMYKGMLCSMASFKEHCAFGFWKASLIFDGKENTPADGMGHFGRITSRKDLPAKKVLLGYIKKAVQLNDEGVKVPKAKPKTDKKDFKVPDYFLAALKKNKKALTVFEGFPYSKKKDYVDWVTEAKTGDTRERRLATSVEWLAEGKSRNWKYEKC
ncbi:MAG TPA: YdeI/OmpD-associated family protein [Candidatus Angelobacter sp.]|jgi:uncharacterized protein YdeI (YjbR/CyaY-like superfamily)|nr:YdeI/OmpD-associated family protein [Candidatus Angelobacter sp.]